MLEPATRKIFLLKMTLGILLGNAAGRTFADGLSFSGRWNGVFIYTFLPLLCIIAIQWVMLSRYLPEWWVITGVIGGLISAFVIGAIYFYVPEQVFRLIIQELNVFSSLLLGVLAVLPQWFILKNKSGYMWVLVNGVGWLLSAAFRNLMFYIPSNDWIRTLVRETSFIFLGLLLSIYLYSYIYKPTTQKVTEDQR